MTPSVSYVQSRRGEGSAYIRNQRKEPRRWRKKPDELAGEPSRAPARGDSAMNLATFLPHKCHPRPLHKNARVGSANLLGRRIAIPMRI
jgi:hypothetical protein